MKLTPDIVEIAIESACNYISQQLSDDFVYHDLSHTVSVVEGVEFLSNKMLVGKQQRRLLSVAAWFHDTGYIHQIDGHEVCSAQLADTLLQKYSVDEDDIATVKACILATKIPQQPQTLLQRIICDADMIHLASKDFLRFSEKLREEWVRTKDLVYSERDWWQLNLDFFTNHRYHTAYGQKFLSEKKERNLEVIRKKIKLLDAIYALRGAAQPALRKRWREQQN